MLEIWKPEVLKRASDTKLNAIIGPEEEWMIPHIINVSGGGPKTEAAVQQILAQLASQPQDIRDSIFHLSSVPEPTRRLWLQAGASCWREIEEEIRHFLDPSNRDSSNRDPCNSIKSVSSQSFRDSGFFCEGQRPFSTGSANTRYSDARDSHPLLGPSSPLGQGIAYQSFGERIIPLQPHSDSQGSTGEQHVNPVENLLSSSMTEPKKPVAEERKAENNDKKFWCPEPGCRTGCTRKETMKTHMEDQHMTWLCSECLEEMSRPGSRQQMERHIKEKHEQDPNARLLVKGRRYFGCPTCTLCVLGFDEYVTHTTSAHSNPKTATLKWESTRLYSLLAHDRRILDTIETEATREMLNWRTMLDNLSAGQQDSLIEDLEGGYPFFTLEGSETFVSDFLNYLRPAPVSSMDWSD